MDTHVHPGNNRDLKYWVEEEQKEIEEWCKVICRSKKLKVRDTKCVGDDRKGEKLAFIDLFNHPAR